MHCKSIKIDMVYLKFAYQDDSPDNAYYLDTECGDVCLVNRYLLDLKDLTDEIELSPNRFLYIPKPDNKDKLEDLYNFADSVKDAKLKNILAVAFESPHVMQAFRAILDPYSEELSRFEKFISNRTEERLLSWLSVHGLAPE